MTEYVIFLIVSGLTFKSLISKHLSDSSWIDKIAFGGWFHSFNAASIVSFPWFQVFPIGPLPFTSPHPSPFNYATIPLVFVRVISIPMKAFCSYEAFYRIEWMMHWHFHYRFLKTAKSTLLFVAKHPFRSVFRINRWSISFFQLASLRILFRIDSPV